MTSAPEDDERTAIRPAAPMPLPSDRTFVPNAPQAATAEAGDGSLPVGTYLQDFEITALIGEGGFGMVYLAIDHSLGRRVALKEFMPSALAGRTAQGVVQVKSEKNRETFDLALKSFINEARMLATFDHPSLIKVYRFWESNGTAYMAMPFVEGRTLKDALRELGAPPNEAWLRKLLLPLTEALQVIHDQQCYHRDIAPDNVMLLAQSERPLLLDFGAARRVIGDATQALTVILKTGYAPVEQYGETPGMRQGPWTDVYALGAMIHFAILGRTPPSSVGRLINDSYVPLVQSAAGRYSKEFLAAIDRTLAVRPEARTQSINMLRLELGLVGTDAGDVTPALAGASDSKDDASEFTPSRPNNLPVQSTRFLGREQEVYDVKEALTRTRLVTLLGMGGLGKTRLSLQVGSEMLAAFPDGVWFLDLASIRDPAFVIDQTAQIFELREEPGRSLLETVVSHLKSRRLLLIVDNCEHLMKPSIALAHALLSDTEGVRILASSREALRLPDERVFPVLPLPLPKKDADLATLLESSAVRLFVERARDHKRNFELTEKEAPAVAELVARLEGIPLALELAAARMRAMSVTDINARLKDRYKLLNRGSESVYERQQTLRALVDWSYEMLSEEEKILLNRLGIFVGGMTLESAEAVCGLEPLSADDVLDDLSSLVEKSLVMLDEREGTARYRMLETIRDYAVEKLEADPEFRTIAAAHAQRYFSVSKAVRDGLKGEDQGVWVQRGEEDIDNLRAAVALAQAGGVDPVITVKMAVALQGFWVLRGRVSEGRAIVRAALTLPEVHSSPVAHAHALYVGAALALAQSDHADAQVLLTECLALRRAIGNPAETAATLSTLAKVQLRGSVAPEVQSVAPEGQPERRRWARSEPAKARESATEALALLRNTGDPVGEAIALQDLGVIALFEGDLPAASDWLTQSHALAQRTKHQEVEAECECLLGAVAMEQGDLAQAQTRFTHSRQICTAAGDSRGAAFAQLWQGKLAIAKGTLALAHSYLAAALVTFQTAEMRVEWIDGLVSVAELAVMEKRETATVQLLSAVEASIRLTHMVRPAREVQASELLITRALESLTPDQADEARRTGENWNLAQATSAALAICA
jgi:predicted ATPase